MIFEIRLPTRISLSGSRICLHVAARTAWTLERRLARRLACGGVW